MKIWRRLNALALLVAFLLGCNIIQASESHRNLGQMNTVRTYMNFSKDIDPARILTMSDLELSIALATPLVTFNEERQVVAALAEKWTLVPPNKIQFQLRKNLKWSNGEVVTAEQYKKSLERSKKLYADDLKALFDSVTNIEAETDHILTFTTKEEVTKSGILLKLTEPMYGLMALKNDGSLDLQRSSGSFELNKSSDNEIQLSINKNWYLFAKDMPSIVEIRRPEKNVDLIENFQKDTWVNLVSGSSLMKASTLKSLKDSGAKTWQRSLDKVFSLYPSKRFLKAHGSGIIQKISSSLDKEKVLAGLSGYTLATQFFPRGYELWSSSEPKSLKSESGTNTSVLKIIIPDNPYAMPLKSSLVKALKESNGVIAECELVPLPEVNDRMKKGDYDILATGIAVADPNFEGAMSFFFEREPAFIQSTSKPNDFAAQIKEARSLATSKERATKMREIIVHAQEAGHVAPLFHFSSLAIAKSGVDLSEVPNSDETVLFSKVRMR